MSRSAGEKQYAWSKVQSGFIIRCIFNDFELFFYYFTHSRNEIIVFYILVITLEGEIGMNGGAK